MEGDTITKVEAVGEHGLLGTKAIEELSAKIVAANGTKVDVMSGATASSKALIYAVNNALDPKTYPYPPVETIIEKTSTNSSTQSSTVSFTNKFGTATTICAHSSCNNYIATSGDTNCCTTHSRKCLECDDYIDEDATYCISCLEDSIKPSANSNSSYSSSEGEFWCMGKNDTCQNKTSDPLDLYCNSCDKNNDNIED